MNHLLEISLLSPDLIETLLHRSFTFKKGKKYPSFPQHRLLTLFYENSTRTRMSFEIAAQRLSIPSHHLDVGFSSISKGETIQDSIATLEAMGINLFVIRHSENKFVYELAQQANPQIHFINAGSGQCSHPSQALLDLMTIYNHKPQLQNLKIAILGDIKHSRVANSLLSLFKKLDMTQIVLIGPEKWLPLEPPLGEIISSLETGIAEADVIICLRVQTERIKADEQLNLESYQEQYCLTKNKLRLAKPNAIVLHPGPINRGIEISSEVADGPHSCILEQVEHGVYMRMAILEQLVQPVNP